MRLRPIVSALPGITAQIAGLEEPHVAFEECRRHRDRIADRYDEAMGFAYPGRAGMMRDADGTETYDSTAVHCAPEFASRIKAGVCPNYSRWASHVAGVMIDDEDEQLDINKQLEPVDAFMFDLINTSSFQTEADELFMDVAVGTGAMEVDERDETNPINCSTIPLGELYFANGPGGLPDPIARERRMTVNRIAVIYPRASGFHDLVTDHGRNEFRVIEIWQRDWGEPAAHRWRCTVFLPDHANKVIWQYDVSGEGACKILVVRWSKASGEPWGRGPLFNCLPDMRILNFAMKGLIDHADLQLAGIWSGEDDGVLNPDTIRLEPGVFVPRAPGSQPLANVVPQSNFDITQFLVEEHRNNIRRALFAEELGDPNRSPKTATEVDARMAELARKVGSPFGRIILEFVMPFIARVRRILKDRNLIEIPIVDGKELRLMSTSPLAEAQRFDDIDRTAKYVATIGQLFGPETASLTIDATEASIYLGERYRVPSKLVRPRKEQEKLAAQIAQSAQGGMMNGGGEQGPVA